MKFGDGKVAFEQEGRIAVVCPRGDVDMGDVKEIVDAFSLALHDTSTDATLIDLSLLTFADSALLNQLLATCSGHTGKGRPLVLCGPLHPPMRRILQITGVDTVLPLAASRREGLHQLGAANCS